MNIYALLQAANPQVPATGAGVFVIFTLIKMVIVFSVYMVSAALLTLDGEGGRDARVTARATRPELAAALGAFHRQLALGILEVALEEAAPEAEGDPVAQGLAALLLDPVALRHVAIVAP
jgi:hypothetical protein